MMYHYFCCILFVTQSNSDTVWAWIQREGDPWRISEHPSSYYKHSREWGGLRWTGECMPSSSNSVYLFRTLCGSKNQVSLQLEGNTLLKTLYISVEKVGSRMFQWKRKWYTIGICVIFKLCQKRKCPFCISLIWNGKIFFYFSQCWGAGGIIVWFKLE